MNSHGLKFESWQKSSRSASGSNCVEVGAAPGVTGVRDSKLGAHSPVLVFDAVRFTGFLGAVRRGRFDG